ncbi:hypothetical protein PPTG_13816 [Phytophthora nicotianae INRA-310]|uniref:DDE-1 domain-containing protein n=1 Tax=Phytophthora nicotianae (strain INRA-310) TaxID=761204 RepID=W2PZ90_PHYN3|nr:hypothetical protein PPTG_13816 [Phytophthora nicotianae INRA-310]ETN05971.1 hypothetical protein PPTG_13816 [Phytophthora nicotianae INRA-310]
MTKPNLSDLEQKAVIDELRRISNNGTLPRGAYAKVATGMGRDPTTISATGSGTLPQLAQASKETGLLKGGLRPVPDSPATWTLHFKPMYNMVHVDEKWLYADRDTRSYLVLEGEELPSRVWKSKRFIPKTMFLAALARPRYDPHRNQEWDGKVGIWDYLLEKVFPAIKVKWPRKDRHQIIFVQQDNAKPNVPPSEPAILAAGTEGGWNIRLFCQTPNSPDLNALDLGVFNSMQCIQHHIHIPRKDIKALIDSVESAFQQLKPHTVNDIVVTLQACMLCILQNEGGLYKLPHLGKAKLRTKKRLPVSLNCSRELYEAAIALFEYYSEETSLLSRSNG